MGENLLAMIDFTPQQLYSVGKPMEEVFWLPIDPKLFNIASELQDVKLQKCVQISERNSLSLLPSYPFTTQKCLVLRKIHQIEGYSPNWLISFTSYLQKKRKLILGNKVQKLSQVYPAIKEVLGMTSQRGLSKDFAPLNLSCPWR
ncbi:uncharacterized protein LOC126699979 [Quercus robur]|uniref:uncharacterized protein LOC126699979 n=1 Tax=Quercus robur TaxID=38942 RepID=UPI0021624DAA|nr:uncharacterized protein LOC126699979 [Quercus robur]